MAWGVSVGVGVLVERVAVALVVLKFVGVAYLVSLGVAAYRHRGQLAATVNEPTNGPRPARAFVEGSVVGLTNPKAIVFFATVLPQFTIPLKEQSAFKSPSSGWSSARWRPRWMLGGPPGPVGGAGGLTMIGLGGGVAATGRHP